MKIVLSIFISSFLFCILIACQKKVYRSNGESIYRSGRNLQGEFMLDKSRSSITLIKSCQGCHGTTGNRMKHTNISYKHLSDPAVYSIPYNDSLISCFLDQDLKSDGQKANIGVRWKMSDADKRDLILFLRELEN